MKAAFKAADALGQIRNPRVLSRLLALAKVLGEAEDGGIEQRAVTNNEAD